MENLFDVNQLVHDFSLTDIARDAIKHEHVDIGFKLVRIHCCIDPGLPKFHRDVIRHQFAPTGVFEDTRDLDESGYRSTEKTSPQAQ